MAVKQDRLVQIGFMETGRRDSWWLPPVLTFAGYTAFIVYTTWAALQNANYWDGNLLSPFYSPELFGKSPHAIFGPEPSWWPNAIFPYSPALLILAFPAGFRMTCYYYRGAYYKAFWADPPGCAVGEPRKTYWGERTFPLIIQNIHRYFMYAAVAFIFLLSYDIYVSMKFPDGFGISLGTLILATNVVLIGSYTFGCHSFRHIAGGVLDRISRASVRKKVYDCSSCLNRRHMLFAWVSMFTVMFCDIYTRLCAMGVWTNWRIL
ncbi:MAG: succinate dehydrogenase [Deltaproteobacteria bacterium]|nr:succinate dehydrogenase [Deltaproteobacteria bacterium]